MQHSLFLRIDQDSVAADDFHSMASALGVMQIHLQEDCFQFFLNEYASIMRCFFLVET